MSEFEQKKIFVEGTLQETMKATDRRIEKVTYTGYQTADGEICETVSVRWKGGHEDVVNVAMTSMKGIAREVFRKI